MLQTEKKGMLQVYTGNGKGKTTAAFGLALRAASAGMKVYIGQFIKDMQYHEVHLEKLFPEGQVVIRQLGCGCYIDREPTPQDCEMAQKGLKIVKEIMMKGEYDLVILDEATIATSFNLITKEELLKAIQSRADHVEVVVTGRYAPEELIQAADLVTEMREIKHYYQKGILSRSGIDH